MKVQWCHLVELSQDLTVYSHFDDFKVDEVETEMEEDEECLTIDDGDETMTNEQETSVVLSDVEVRHIIEMVRDDWLCICLDMAFSYSFHLWNQIF